MIKTALITAATRRSYQALGGSVRFARNLAWCSTLQSEKPMHVEPDTKGALGR